MVGVKPNRRHRRFPAYAGLTQLCSVLGCNNVPRTRGAFSPNHFALLRRRPRPILINLRIASARFGRSSCSTAQASISLRNSGVNRTPDIGLSPVAGRPIFFGL